MASEYKRNEAETNRLVDYLMKKFGPEDGQ